MAVEFDISGDRGRLRPELVQRPENGAYLSSLVVHEGDHAELDDLVAAVVQAAGLEVDRDFSMGPVGA
jgi:hypothetical protein